jgi:hypothetical protein
MSRKLGRLPHDRALFARLLTVASHLAVLPDAPAVVSGAETQLWGAGACAATTC